MSNVKKRIFVVEDDSDVAALVCTRLEDFGFDVDCYHHGRDALAALERRPPDACIIDLGLPDMDGLELVRTIQNRYRSAVIVLTGRSDTSDRIVGLELGADDYVVKPFDARELVARVNSVLRRSQNNRANPDTHESRTIARFAGWRFDSEALALASPQGDVVQLSAAEARLLKAFLDAPQRVLSRDHLLDPTGSRSHLPYDRSIDVRISRLRHRLEADPQHPEVIKTVYGAGYIFTERVEWS